MWKVCPLRPVKCGLYMQVVFIYRWSLELEEVRLYFTFSDLAVLECTADTLVVECFPCGNIFLLS